METIPKYLTDRAEMIVSSRPQQLFMWNNSYNKFRTFPPVDEIYGRFSDRNMQRKDVVDLMKEDAYLGFIAAMMWGGINATRPSTKGGNDTPFLKLLQCSRKKVTECIDHARNEILKGSIAELFEDFSHRGWHKIPGVDAAYFTKLFYFLGQTLDDTLSLKPLIWDKWTSNAHCALLIDSGGDTQIPYPGINRHLPYSLLLPQGTAKAALYQQYVRDFNGWARGIGVAAGKLEEFVFGFSLKQSKSETNPRIELWNLIEGHFSDRQHFPISSNRAERRPKKHAVRYGPERRSQSGENVEGVKQGSKYFNLQEFLKACRSRNERLVQISISDIASITGSMLPDWAFKRKESFWSNSCFTDHVQKRAWLSQKYIVSHISVDELQRSGEVCFELVDDK